MSFIFTIFTIYQEERKKKKEKSILYCQFDTTYAEKNL